jgi:TDG/mug DNA glycosylase family protein
MPGRESLRAGRYYAHPRNLFWKIMGSILGFEPDLPYQRRLARLLDADVALWDVLQTCRRTGSLDSCIEPGSIVPNDICGFLVGHPYIKRVCFNGRMAETWFRKYIQLPPEQAKGITLVHLPSTSPANASWSPTAKEEVWKTAFFDIARL